MGAIAQLGERFAGSEEVVGSIPSSSTKFVIWYQIPSLSIMEICVSSSFFSEIIFKIIKLSSSYEHARQRAYFYQAVACQYATWRIPKLNLQC